MIIKVPFVFQAMVIPKGCQKSREVYVADWLSLEIDDETDIQFAGTVQTEAAHDHEKTLHLYHGGDQFWHAFSISNGRDTPPTVPGVDEFIAILQSPYENFRVRSLDGTLRAKGLNFSELPAADRIKVDGSIREYLCDNREHRIQDVIDAVEPYCFHGGEVFIKAIEPYYCINTFGLGANHGGTALFVETQSRRSAADSPHRAFSLAQKEQAIEQAQTVARHRGDHDSCPIVPHSDVYLRKPDLFTFDPMSREALDRGDITLPQFLANRGEATDGLSQLIRETAAKVAQGVEEKPIKDQIAWLSGHDVERNDILNCFNVR